MLRLDLVPTVVKGQGTWYPYPTDEAQADMNLYCNRLPKLVEERDMLLAERLESELFWHALKWAAIGVGVGAAIIGSVWLGDSLSRGLLRF